MKVKRYYYFTPRVSVWMGGNIGIVFSRHHEDQARRSATGVHPNFSEAPRLTLTLLEPQSRCGDKPLNSQVVCPQNGTAVVKGLRSSTPHPKIDVSKNITRTASRGVIPWPNHTTKSHFGTRLTFRRFSVKEPRHSETNLAETCYLFAS